MAGDTKLAGMLGDGNVPGTAARVVIQGGHAAAQAHEAARHLGGIGGIAGHLQDFVQAEAARRRGRSVPLPPGFVPIDQFEVAQWMPWATDGEISVAQGWAAIDAAIASQPRDIAMKLSALLEATRPGQQPDARGSACCELAQFFRDGALGVPRSPFFSGWLLMLAIQHGHPEAVERTSALFASQPLLTDQFKDYFAAVADLWQLVFAGQWSVTFTNFGHAPMDYLYSLNADGTMEGQWAGMQGGAAGMLASQVVSSIASAVAIRGAWSYRRATSGPNTFSRTVQFDQRTELTMPILGSMSTAQQVAIELQGWKDGVLWGHDQNGFEWLLSSRERTHTERHQVLMQAVERGTPRR